ncbi:hypothetical protein Pelo_2245 [Pelomyxa schiedti]|nr:hypothetical protein Pelo_2245 [Pelomyxa schiedti]
MSDAGESPEKAKSASQEFSLVVQVGSGFNPGMQKGTEDKSLAYCPGPTLYKHSISLNYLDGTTGSILFAIIPNREKTPLEENTDMICENVSTSNCGDWHFRLANMYWDTDRTNPSSYVTARYPPPTAVHSRLWGYLLYPALSAAYTFAPSVRALWEVAPPPEEPEGEFDVTISLILEHQVRCASRVSWTKWKSATSVAHSCRAFVVSVGPKTVIIHQLETEARVVERHAIDFVGDLLTSS